MVQFLVIGTIFSQHNLVPYYHGTTDHDHGCRRASWVLVLLTKLLQLRAIAAVQLVLDSCGDCSHVHGVKVDTHYTTEVWKIAVANTRQMMAGDSDEEVRYDAS